MMAELLDRKQLKAEEAERLGNAQVSPKAMTALYLGILLGLDLIEQFTSGWGIVYTFFEILVGLFGAVLGAGFTLYCMAIRRGERAEYLTLFDGFTFVGKIILLTVMETLFIVLWSMLFIIPGIIAAYRYQFALYNLYENPGIDVMDALDMSKRQTMGYKSQLFMLDLSYLGWNLLASLPSLVVLVQMYRLIFQAATDNPAALYSLARMTGGLGGVPPVIWLTGISLWALAVRLFYFPHMTCVNLAYFDAAKRTSGIRADGGGQDALPGPGDGGWNGL